jgi:hypothetical protein
MREGVAGAHAQAAVRGDGEEAPAPTYVVECYWPGIAEDQARDALARVARIPQCTASHGDSARCIGCILVPSDGLALFLFQGPSAAIVQSWSTWAGVPFDRIVEAVQIEAAD